MAKTNYTVFNKCKNTDCNTQIEIRMIGNPNHNEYGLPIKKHRTRNFCSTSCQKQWQKTMTWEDRFGTEYAETLKKKRSNALSLNNPSTNPAVALKISKSLKKFIAENPDSRIGENNPFFGKKHSVETIEKWKTEKRWRWSYTNEQKQKQTQNTPKGEHHPNWQGGISSGEYGSEFTKEYKQQIKKHYNSSCQICGIETDILDIHHIDYDKKNNLFENLIPLCKVCHGKTNYNREQWKNTLTKNN